MASFDSSFELDVSINSLINDTVDSLDKIQISIEQERISADNFIDKLIVHYLKHNLTLVCLEELMDLLNENRDICDKLPNRKKQILSMFRDGKDMIEVIYFIRCKKCRKIVKQCSENIQVVCCDEILKKTETNFFVYMPLKKQIIQSIQKNWQHIKDFDQCKEVTEAISDAHDGNILKEVLKIYENDDLNILSLCLNVDGANKFNSNMVSLWPVQFVQNYLPPRIRFQPHNILVAGLLYTEVKFNFREYLLPLIDELNYLKENQITIHIEGEDYSFKPVVTHCAVDLPAKSKLQETKQFGGYEACTYCEIPGELVSVKTSKKSKKTKNDQANEETKINKFVRYVEGECQHSLRREQDVLKQMLVVSPSSSNEAIKGIKDVTCLVALEHFNIVDSVGIDYMHCVLLGVQKRLTNFFCNPKFSTAKFYVTPKKRKLLNERILAIKPNSNVVRKPRSLELRSKFKASEFRSMLLYYFPVCLTGCVPKVYADHVRLLSAATYILLQRTITHDEIDEADKMLCKFVKEHQEIFGKENMVMVIHLLKHLAQSVRKLGPLWCQSAFPFERNNGVLLQMVNGKSDVLLQSSSKYCLSKSVGRHHKQSKRNISNKILLGRSVKIVEKSLLAFNVGTLKAVNLSNKTLNVHKRINLKHVIYTSTLYTRAKKSVDYFIGLEDDIIGKAKFYFELNDQTFVLMEEFETTEYTYHIAKVQATGRKILAPINNIQKKFIYIEVGLSRYVALEPNPYEME